MIIIITNIIEYRYWLGPFMDFLSVFSSNQLSFWNKNFFKPPKIVQKLSKITDKNHKTVFNHFKLTAIGQFWGNFFQKFTNDIFGNRLRDYVKRNRRKARLVLLPNYYLVKKIFLNISNNHNCTPKQNSVIYFQFITLLISSY